MKEIVTKELVDKVMNHINHYNKQVTYGVIAVEDVEKYRIQMVEGIVKSVLDKIM